MRAQSHDEQRRGDGNERQRASTRAPREDARCERDLGHTKQLVGDLHLPAREESNIGEGSGSNHGVAEPGATELVRHVRK